MQNPKKAIAQRAMLRAALFLLLSAGLEAQTAGGYFPDDVMAPWEGGNGYYAAWAHGPSADPGFFPVAVWLQQPANAPRFAQIGVNTLIGLWDGPTEAQLRAAAGHRMPVICSQNRVGLASREKGPIVGWMHTDEPDNAQPNGSGGYLPPLSPKEIIAGYHRMRDGDPTRPVYLNLGQGVAWDGWYGRHNRTRHPEDYAEYAKGADILSFDIYPVNSGDAAVKGKPWLVAHGVDRLRKWSGYKKAVWCLLECTRIDAAAGRKPTPSEVRAEVWMSLIHGAMGIGYFAHVMNPFNETGLLDDPEMKSAVSAINFQVASLARILNTQSVANGVTVKSAKASIPVDTMVKRVAGTTYIFAVSMRPGATTAIFQARGFSGKSRVMVLDEGREIEMTEGKFQDAFSDYAVHVYSLKP